jgi:REP element-mobilizing transposase RayT
MWNLPPPPGFQGLREDLPLDVYVRHLPHWRQPGATYFVTLRLADSLPKAKREELAILRRDWESSHPPPWDREVLEALARQLTEREESWLDQGMGSCLLKDPGLASLLVQAMHHFDGSRHELGAYVIMPNHVHVLLRPLTWEEHPLEAILGSWKQFSAHRINARRANKGELWQQESYDRIVRDEEHLYRCLQYIGRNPARAGLTPMACPLWVRPSWAALGWKLVE